MDDHGCDELNTIPLRATLGECYLAFGSSRDYAGPLLDELLEEAEQTPGMVQRCRIRG